MAKEKKTECKCEEVTENVTETEEVKEVKEEISVEEQLKAEVASLKDQLLRNQAELENFKRRINDERIKERKYASMDVCKGLLTPLDTFDLALKQEIKDEVMKNFIQGFKMIEDQIYNALKDQGVKEIEALDKDYDPFYHQAIMKEKVEGTEPNKVVEVLQKGYMFKDRVLRPSIVKISE